MHDQSFGGVLTQGFISRFLGGGKPAKKSGPAALLENLEARSFMSGSSLLTPSALVATVSSPTAIKLSWSDPDKNAAGFVVMRSENGSSYSQIAKLTSNKTLSYTDSKALSNHTYYYKVGAYKGTEFSEQSSAAQVFTPLITPSSFSATVQGSSAVLLKWKGMDSAATSYNILRSVDGKSYSVIGSASGFSAASYTDSSVSSGTAYMYEIQAKTEANASAVSGVVKAATSLKAPTGVQVSAGYTSVSISWGGLDAAAKNYVVMRSTDNKTYSTVTTLGPSATTFVDTTAATGTAYYYKVQAKNAVAPAATSEAVQATTLVLAPTAVTATISETKVNLGWKDTNRKGMGYVVLRSSDGSNYSEIATLKGGSAASFVDATVAPGTSYSYKVRAFTGSLSSEGSGAASVQTPVGKGQTTITSRYGSEVVITSYGAVDSIAVSQSNSTYTIVINGQSFTQAVLPAGLFIYDRTGGDTITISASVAARTTIAAIGAGITSIVSSASNISAWMDTTDKFTGSGAVHMIGSFAGGVSKAVGAAYANPKDSGTTFKASGSLFGAGPSADDIRQGSTGDCYFLASLSEFAGVNPAVVQESAVDLGDGTYVVRFFKNNAPVYVRVSNDLPSGGFGGYKFAHPGASGSLWAPIMEKAFAYFRTGANTYASISSGWMGEVYTDFGVKSSTVSLSGSEMAFYSAMASKLSSGLAVTFGTSGSAPNLVRGHAYSLVSVSVEAGVTHYVVRNPWGSKGTAIESNDGYSTLTFAQMQANFTAGAAAIA